MNSICNKFNQAGFSLAEILVSMGVFAVIIFAAASVFTVSQESSRISNQKSKAVQYMRDYIEKLKNIRRDDWDNLVNGTYIFVENGSNIELFATVDGEEFDGYTRILEISDVLRDTNGNIVQTPGLVDPSSKNITVTVSWDGFRPGSISESMIFTRYMDNLSWLQTTETDFLAGTHEGTTVVNGEGGEVILGAGGSASWCEPNLTIVGLDLPKSGVANAITAIEGRAFAGTGENASGESFVNIDIQDTNPPTASVVESIDGYKTNDVFGEELYGYIATDTNSEEVVIIDISSEPYTKIGYYDVPGNTDANSIYIDGLVGYVVASNKLYNFDVTSKSGSRPGIDSDGVALSGTGTGVYVNGSYAYVTTAGMQRLQIIDISDPANMSVVGYASLAGGAGRDVVVNATGTRAYVTTSADASNPEVYIVNISTKTGSHAVTGSYDTNGMDPRGIEVLPGSRAVIVGTGGEEYQVINISDESSPFRCGGMEVDSGIYDSASVLEGDNDAYTYILTGDSNQEFRIIEGGPGGSFATSGVFESQTLDTTFNSTGFNRFSVTEVEPIGTSIQYRFAAKEPAPGGCAATTFDEFDFVGPNGSLTEFFDGESGIPLDNDGLGYENPSQCFRVRAYLYTNDLQTPILKDFSVNYSP